MSISFLHRLHGYFEPAHAMWASQKLLERGTLHDAQWAKSILHQAASICPYDQSLDKLVNTLAVQLQDSPPIALQDDAFAISLQDALSLVESKNEDVLALYQGASSPLLRHICLGNMWQNGLEPERFTELLATLPDNQERSKPFFAWAALHLGHEQLALKLVEGSPKSWLSLNLLAQLALRQGDTHTALEKWRWSLSVEPGQPHLVERIAQFDLLGRTLPSPDEYKVHVLFYTFNKFETTLATLQSLLASDIGQARITLLNNGSTTFSAEDFSAAVEQIAQGRDVELIHLPVNIGAPAARNWLYRLSHVQEADYIAFLDDDVLLPHTWLRLYIQDLHDYPDTCAVGPKGINPHPYKTIQYIYRYFQEVGERKIRFTNNAPMIFDVGQYDGRRPCLSVMGCCHLFDKKRMARLGVPDFDIRFAPSQVDDLERDIQIWKHGGRVLYDGRVEVVHMQDAGRAAPKTEAAWGHVWGNHMKMEAKFTGRELRSIDQNVRDIEEQHWQDCLEKAWDILPERCQKFWVGQSDKKAS